MNRVITVCLTLFFHGLCYIYIFGTQLLSNELKLSFIQPSDREEILSKEDISLDFPELIDL